MFKIILIGSVCMYLLLYHIGWVILAGLICSGIYVLKNYDLTPVVDKDHEDDLSQRPTTEERYAKEVEGLMKPGYKDDPKWQELGKKVKEHNAQQDELARQADHLEELTNEVI